MARTCIEAMAATQGHTQSLHTNALDEALALPTDFSARIARNTQLFLQQESGTCRVIDPWGGSYYVERLTYELARKAWAHIEEVEAAGGMTAAIEAGIPKLRIEEAAARTQARIDSGRQPVIGVNVFQLDEPEQIDVLKVDNSAVRAAQIAKLQRLRAERDSAACDAALAALTAAAQASVDGTRAGGLEQNLLKLSLDAARGRLRRRDLDGDGAGVRPPHRVDPYDLGRVPVRGRRIAQRRRRARAHRRASPSEHGRRPRVLIAKMGQDGHDRGQKVIATAFADLGFDVDVGPLFQTPQEVARQAVEADVHIVGASSLAAGHLTLVPELKQALAEYGRDDILVVVGGVIPPQDFDALREAGAAAIFPPGTVIADAAADLLDQLDAGVLTRLTKAQRRRARRITSSTWWAPAGGLGRVRVSCDLDLEVGGQQAGHRVDADVVGGVEAVVRCACWLVGQVMADGEQRAAWSDRIEQPPHRVVTGGGEQCRVLDVHQVVRAGLGRGLEQVGAAPVDLDAGGLAAPAAARRQRRRCRQR